MEITINVPDIMARDLAFALNYSKTNEELIIRILTRFYADMFNPLTGQQIKD